MKKILLLVVLAVLMIGCQSQSNHYKYVIEHLFATEEISYLHKDMANEDSQKVLNKFKEVYGDYVTDSCLTTLATELSVFQTQAYMKNKDMSVSNIEIKEIDDYMEIKCQVKVNEKEEEVLLHGQEIDGKVSSLRIMNGEELQKLL